MMRKFWWSLLPFMVVALCACGKEEPTDGNGDNTGNGNVLGSGFEILRHSPMLIWSMLRVVHF